MISVPASRLLRLGVEIFEVQGLPRDKSEFLAETLVEANLTGHDSHGVAYYVTYSDRIREGHIDVTAKPEIVKETAASAFIDGQWAPGQLTAKFAIDVVIEKAKGHAISAVGAFNCNHIGRLGYYTNYAAKQGVVAMMFANVGHPLVSVYNGTGAVLGTNPFSAAVPTKNARPFLVDYATSVVAAGKIGVARAKNEKIPIHWVRDKEGKPTDDPWATETGGWQVPFGEYKGYGLQLLSELLGAVMTGSRTGLDVETEPPSPNGVFVIAIDPDAFVGLDAFVGGTDGVLTEVKKIPPETGKKVLIPGEPEWDSKEKRLREGIPLPDETWEKIIELTKKLGIDS
jgi:LDH2 family malate/lactate/ureidoglycolate dehydrogenase